MTRSAMFGAILSATTLWGACGSDADEAPRGNAGRTGGGGKAGASGAAGAGKAGAAGSGGAVSGGSAGVAGGGGAGGTMPDASMGGGGGAGGGDASAGAGGGAATGGTNGSAGTGGTNGSAGTGGTNGGAGASGAAGKGGAAGTSGSGGVSGSSGTGGSGGVSPLCTPAAASSVFYVAPTPTGNDSNNGSTGSPWATINHAVQTVPDGATVLVRAGTYNGRVQLDRVFAQGIVVRAEQPYQARLRHTGTVVTSYYGEGIRLEGFDIAHAGAGAEALVIQIQDLRAGAATTSRITLRNNVLHDSYNNDILKINNGAANVTVEGNIFYNQTGSDEHIDVNSVTDVVIQNNVFFNDFAGSGRSTLNDTSSYIVVKDSNTDTDGVVGSQRITIRRNVFLNWEGSAGSNFVLCGEDGVNFFETQNMLVENNLMLGNSANTMRSSFGIKGCKDVTFRNNTVVGNLPSNAFAMRMNREGSNLAIENARYFNNIWSDPTGTMSDFSDTLSADITSFTLDTNVYYNGGSAIPVDSADHVNVTNDTNARVGDPRLPNLTSIVLPRLNATGGTFADGSTSTCQAFTRLVSAYCTLGTGSLAIDAARASDAPSDDITGKARGSAPDIGACER